MTIGVGGSSIDNELGSLSNMTGDVASIHVSEFQARLKKAQSLMQQNNISATYLNAGTNLYYFTGTRWSPSERMVGAIIPASGKIQYIAPAFEEGTLKDFMEVEGGINCWLEHESPYQLFGKILTQMGIKDGYIAIDESTPYFIFDGIQQTNPAYEFKNAKSITAGCRMQKSKAEIAILQRAKDMTLEVQKSVAKILTPGISTQEVKSFIHAAHMQVGAASGSYFCIVLFGEDSAYPHGVRNPSPLKENDIVLIDTGCQLHGYLSDITRTYVYGTPNKRQSEVWEIEKNAQIEAFNAAQIGSPCSDIDYAARKYLESEGFGPEYNTPGLPHRTGHGVGLDIHEWPYLVRNDDTLLAEGMCFSNEPMICIPGEFGVRHEDHIYMTDSGPCWFTKPAHSINDPFGYEA